MEPMSRYEKTILVLALGMVVTLLLIATKRESLAPVIKQNKQEMARMKADLSELKHLYHLERSRVAALREELAKKGTR